MSRYRVRRLTPNVSASCTPDTGCRRWRNASSNFNKRVARVDMDVAETAAVDRRYLSLQRVDIPQRPNQATCALVGLGLGWMVAGTLGGALGAGEFTRRT